MEFLVFGGSPVSVPYAHSADKVFRKQFLKSMEKPLKEIDPAMSLKAAR
jgi:hypothetical protein